MSTRKTNLIQSFFRNKNGQIVLGQRPNLPLLLWLGFTAATSLLPAGAIATTTSWLARASIIVWAVAELGWGVNGFRRSLGVIVLGWSLYSIFW